MNHPQYVDLASQPAAYWRPMLAQRVSLHCDSIPPKAARSKRLTNSRVHGMIVTVIKVIRSLTFSLRFANTVKKQKLDDLWLVYQRAVNYFILDDEISDEADYRDFDGPIGVRFKQAALRQTQAILRADKDYDRMPELTKPSMTLDQRFIRVEKANNSFDYWIRISTLDKGHPILVPVKSYDHANKYFRRWSLINGGRLLRNDSSEWFIQLVFQKAGRKRSVKKAKGFDVGYRKLLTDSNGKKYGTRIKKLTEKAARKQQGSKADKRVREEIKNYVGATVKEAVTGRFNIAVENLKNLKDNKKGKWNKAINRKFGYWYYSLTLKRMRDRAELFGVRYKTVNPQYTSQTCPKCGHIDKLNRHGERFKCLRCDYSGDADHVGALNILAGGFAQELP